MASRKTSDAGIAFIESFEGFRPAPYPDVAGFLSIGFGHRIRPSELFTFLDEEDATQLLKQDCSHAESAVNQCVHVVLNQNQFDALVSFCYNLGGGTLLKSTLLRKLNDGDYQNAANEILRFDHAGGVVVPGLTRRRQAERELFLTPVQGANTSLTVASGRATVCE